MPILNTRGRQTRCATVHAATWLSVSITQDLQHCTSSQYGRRLHCWTPLRIDAVSRFTQNNNFTFQTFQKIIINVWDQFIFYWKPFPFIGFCYESFSTGVCALPIMQLLIDFYFHFCDRRVSILSLTVTHESAVGNLWYSTRIPGPKLIRFKKKRQLLHILHKLAGSKSQCHENRLPYITFWSLIPMGCTCDIVWRVV